MMGVIYMLLAYVDWLAMGNFSPKYQQLVIGRHTWFSGIREAFVSGDHEPWVFRGGLAADLQRLMPVDSGNDLFLYQYPDTPTSQMYQIRQYRPEDQTQCYNIALSTWNDGMDSALDYPGHPNMVGEKVLGHFVTFCPNLAFVFEDSEGRIVGYVMAAPNLKDYHQQMSQVWLPGLRTKYFKVDPNEGDMLTPCEVTINSLHEEPAPHNVEDPEAWALCRLALLPTVIDASLARRSIMLLLACLRTSGVLKVLTEVSNKEKYMADLYTKLGFTWLADSTATAETTVVPQFM